MSVIKNERVKMSAAILHIFGLTASLGLCLAKLPSANAQQSTPQGSALHLTRIPDFKPLPAGAVRLSPTDSAALVLKRVDPEYPPLAQKAHVLGTVTVQGLLDESGKLIDSGAIFGPVQLRDAALYGLKQWKFKPYTLNGEPKAALVSYSFTFH